MSNVEVIDFVRQRIAEEMNVGEVRLYYAIQEWNISNEWRYFTHSGHGLWKLVVIVSYEYRYSRLS